MPPTAKDNVKDYDDIMSTYDPSKNMSLNILTKYEKASIVGMRMEQLARGAQSLLEIGKNANNKDKDKETKRALFDPYEIALQELMERKIPFMIARTLPNGQREYWKLKDMVIR